MPVPSLSSTIFLLFQNDHCSSFVYCQVPFLCRAETKALIGGGGVYSYIHVLPDEFLLKSVVITVDLPINALVSALFLCHLEQSGFSDGGGGGGG